MNENPEAPASLKCGLEVEIREDGEWVARECGEPADWTLRVAVNNGALSERVNRCGDHVGGCLAFHLDIPSTSQLLVARVVK